MKKCPRCKLVNPQGAERCDCGYDFFTGETKASYVDRIAKHDVAKEVRLFALALVALGAVAFVARFLVGRPASLLVFIVWAGVVYYLSIQFGRRKRWARTALAMLTLPIGAVLFTGRYRQFLEGQGEGT